MTSTQNLAARLRDGASGCSRSRTPDIRSTPPKGSGLRISLSPSPNAKRAVLKRKIVNDDQSSDAYPAQEANGTPPMKKLALS